MTRPETLIRSAADAEKARDTLYYLDMTHAYRKLAGVARISYYMYMHAVQACETRNFLFGVLSFHGVSFLLLYASKCDGRFKKFPWPWLIPNPRMGGAPLLEPSASTVGTPDVGVSVFV